MAHGSMRRKIPQLREALTGHFDEHHAFICATMLCRIDALAAGIADLDARIEAMIAPFAAAVEKLDEITGVGVRSAPGDHRRDRRGHDRFPTAAHLVSWAKFSPIDAQSAEGARLLMASMRESSAFGDGSLPLRAPEVEPPVICRRLS